MRNATNAIAPTAIVPMATPSTSAPLPEDDEGVLVPRSLTILRATFLWAIPYTELVTVIPTEY